MFTTKICRFFFCFFFEIVIKFAKLFQRFMDKYLKLFHFPKTVVRRYSAKQVLLKNCEFCQFLSMAASASHKIRNCLQILLLLSSEIKQINKLLSPLKSSENDMFQGE